MEPASTRRFDQLSFSTAPFVGREAELRVLHAALESAAAGHGQLVLIAGEVRIGKTRILDVYSAEAGACGARVLWGRCHEWESAPPYWPWIRVLGPAQRVLVAGYIMNSTSRCRSPLLHLVDGSLNRKDRLLRPPLAQRERE